MYNAVTETEVETEAKMQLRPKPQSIYTTTALQCSAQQFEFVEHKSCLTHRRQVSVLPQLICHCLCVCQLPSDPLNFCLSFLQLPSVLLPSSLSLTQN